MSEGVKVAIVGSGNIGTDLLYKVLENPGGMEVAMMAGVDPDSRGLARARGLGIEVTAEGIGPVLADPDIRIVFDATSAGAHRVHAEQLREAGMIAVDMTPAAVGPFVVPPVNLLEHADVGNVNLITCGGQATVPIVHAISRVTPVRYAEMVSTISSASAGPGTRQNIDEFTSTTARALEVVGGARQGKAIIVLNPADPPIMMRNTVYAVPDEEDFDEEAIIASVLRMVDEVRSYVPGYRLAHPIAFDERATAWGTRRIVAVLLEVEGAGHFLAPHAGNLDIMTAAARRVGELLAREPLGTAMRGVGA